MVVCPNYCPATFYNGFDCPINNIRYSIEPWCVGISRIHTTPVTAPIITHHPMTMSAVVVDGVSCAYDSCESVWVGVVIAHPAGYVIQSDLETYLAPVCVPFMLSFTGSHSGSRLYSNV